MVFERIQRIICSTNYLHVEFFHQSAGREFRRAKLRGTNIINPLSGSRIEQFIHPESPFEFQVSPVVKGVSHGVRHCFHPFFVLFPVRSIFTCTVFFINTVGAHRTPFVMVTLEPNLPQVVELMVFRNVFRIQMAVIIDNRLSL